MQGEDFVLDRCSDFFVVRSYIISYDILFFIGKRKKNELISFDREGFNFLYKVG